MNTDPTKRDRAELFKDVAELSKMLYADLKKRKAEQSTVSKVWEWLRK